MNSKQAFLKAFTDNQSKSLIEQLGWKGRVNAQVYYDDVIIGGNRTISIPEIGDVMLIIKVHAKYTEMEGTQQNWVTTRSTDTYISFNIEWRFGLNLGDGNGLELEDMYRNGVIHLDHFSPSEQLITGKITPPLASNVKVSVDRFDYESMSIREAVNKMTKNIESAIRMIKANYINNATEYITSLLELGLNEMFDDEAELAAEGGI